MTQEKMTKNTLVMCDASIKQHDAATLDTPTKDMTRAHLLRVLETSNPRCIEGSPQLKLQLT